MKKYTAIFAWCLAMLCMAAAVHAQVGFVGHQPGTPGGGFSGASAAPPQGAAGQPWPQQGFSGQLTPVSVAQVSSFPNKTPAILRGRIVQFLGGDRYLFRDATGDIVIKIKHNRWWGLTVGPNDLVELGGELKRDKRTWQIRYFDAKAIRRA